MGTGWQHVFALVLNGLMLLGTLRAGVNTWTSLGPDGGAGTLEVDPHNRGTVYAATAAGLFKSRDAGTNWTVMMPLPAGSGGITSLILDPQIPDTVYAATRQSWEPRNSGLLDQADFSALAIDPQSESTLYAVLGGRGVFKSSNGGESWNAVNAGLPTISVNGTQSYLVTSLVIQPTNPGTLYVNGNGVFRSTDAGVTWKAVNTGLTMFEVNSLAIDSQDTRTVYAGTVGGLFAITFEDDL